MSYAQPEVVKVKNVLCEVNSDKYISIEIADAAQATSGILYHQFRAVLFSDALDGLERDLMDANVPEDRVRLLGRMERCYGWFFLQSSLACDTGPLYFNDSPRGFTSDLILPYGSRYYLNKIKEMQDLIKAETGK